MADLRRILSVEDDPDIAVLLGIALADIGGFETRVCGAPGEAIALASAFAPDLVLLDYRMPELSGADLLVELRALPGLEETPILFMTASVMPEQVERLMALGAAAVLAKPFDPVALPDQIRAIWERLRERRAAE